MAWDNGTDEFGYFSIVTTSGRVTATVLSSAVISILRVPTLKRSSRNFLDCGRNPTKRPRLVEIRPLSGCRCTTPSAYRYLCPSDRPQSAIGDDAMRPAFLTNEGRVIDWISQIAQRTQPRHAAWSISARSCKWYQYDVSCDDGAQDGRDAERQHQRPDLRL